MNEESWFERGHVAIVTGASKGFGRALARALAGHGISLVIDARDAAQLGEAERDLARSTDVVAIPGDVTDGEHVRALVDAARARFGRLDLVVNNVASIGAAPLPALEAIGLPALRAIYETNVFAPLHLIALALPLLRRGGGGTIVNVTSDAAVEPYAGWGGYGSSKAALEQLSRVLAAELDGANVGVIVADPGDMDTELHRLAVPDADPSQLADPHDVAPALLRVIAGARARFVRVALQGASFEGAVLA